MKDTTKTGYPSIDKPWLKYYSEEAINFPVPETTLYEFLLQNGKNHLKNTALNYYGRKISYKELFDNIEITASAYSAMGITQGDIVTGICPSFPEIIYSFYAINKIGAVSNWLDPRMDADTILNDLKLTNTRALLLFDSFYEKFKPIADELRIPVILFSVEDSLPLVARVLYSTKNKSTVRIGTAQKYKDVIKKYSGCKSETVRFCPNQLAVLEHTGGTTGVSKAVMLSNENINSVVTQYFSQGDNLHESHTWLTVAFPFTAYTLICSHHLPLWLGMCCILCYDTQLENIEDILLKHRANHMANTPVMWEHLIHSPKAQNTDFSFLINPIVGADTLNIEKEKQINAFLAAHGCKFVIGKGYGMTEIGSAVSACISGICNKIGSVGIPFPKTVISIFDMETGEELPCGSQGEICISGPSVMLGYYKNQEETQKVLKVHADGLVWMHSGDIGHMDEDGCLFIDGRIKRMLIDHHGFKIFAPAIETILQQVPGVEKCCVVGIKDREYQAGQVPVAFIVSNGDVPSDTLLEEIKKKCHSDLPEYFVPSRFIFVAEFPYTSAAKVDYRSLEEQAENKI